MYSFTNIVSDIGILFTTSLPFKITAISPEPIYISELYKTIINDRGYIKIVIFPTSFLINENKVTLFCGHNDKNGWLLHFNRSALLHSLIPVTSAHKNNI